MSTPSLARWLGITVGIAIVIGAAVGVLTKLLGLPSWMSGAISGALIVVVLTPLWRRRSA